MTAHVPNWRVYDVARRHISYEPIRLDRDKDDPTDLEEITRWTSRIILFSGLAAAIIIGLVVLAFVLSEPSGVFVRSW
jgi:hypothetical protein